VGYGNNSACVNQTVSPGYININTTAPGVYMSCGYGLQYDKVTAYYLLDHSDLTWVAANASSMLTIPNSITLNGTNGILWPMKFARTYYNGQWTLGKALVGNGAFVFQFYGATGEISYTDNFQILTCTPFTSGATTTPRSPARTTSTSEFKI